MAEAPPPRADAIRPDEVDHTDDLVRDHAGEEISLRPSPRSFQTFDRARHHAEAQLRITYCLLSIVAATILAAFIAMLGFAVTVADLDTLLTVVLTPLVTILGTAVGFYFGRSERD